MSLQEAGETRRVFPPVERTEGDATAASRDASPDSAVVTTDALVAELRAVIANLRQDRDYWREQAQRLALAAPAPAKPLTWWRWLRATG